MNDARIERPSENGVTVEFGALMTVVVSQGSVVQVDLVNKRVPGRAQNYLLKFRLWGPDDSHERWDVPVTADFVSETLSRLDNARIPPRGHSGLGLDGTSYQIILGHPYGSRYSWWMGTPSGWEPLAEVMQALMSRSGRYVP